MAETTMFLAKMPVPSAQTLESLAAVLPQPPHQLLGRRPGPLVLPDNIVCFQRRAASELNRPRRGRALHHRFVLIIALRETVGVCVDDRVIRLRAGEGLLVFPFQFHHYIEKDADKLFWLFITFDLADAESLQSMHYRPFTVTPEVRALTSQLITAYHEEGRMSELPALLLALLLARLRRQGPAPRHKHTPFAAPGMVMQVNQLAHRAGEPIGIKEIARGLGISQSHLRARFRASCGVSLGRHLGGCDSSGPAGCCDSRPTGFRKSPSNAASIQSTASAGRFAPHSTNHPWRTDSRSVRGAVPAAVGPSVQWPAEEPDLGKPMAETRTARSLRGAFTLELSF